MSLDLIDHINVIDRELERARMLCQLQVLLATAGPDDAEHSLLLLELVGACVSQVETAMHNLSAHLRADGP